MFQGKVSGFGSDIRVPCLPALGHAGGRGGCPGPSALGPGSSASGRQGQQRVSLWDRAAPRAAATPTRVSLRPELAPVPGHLLLAFRRTPVPSVPLGLERPLSPRFPFGPAACGPPWLGGGGAARGHWDPRPHGEQPSAPRFPALSGPGTRPPRPGAGPLSPAPGSSRSWATPLPPCEGTWGWRGLGIRRRGEGAPGDCPALQLVKKVVQSGDTACLQPTLDVFSPEDRQLLQGHCHARALAILRARPSRAEGTAHTREAIAYLSLAIFAAGRSCPPALGFPSCAGYVGAR